MLLSLLFFVFKLTLQQYGDKVQVMEAIRMSEQDDIEKVYRLAIFIGISHFVQALLESSKQSSEYQDIEREIEEAVLAASRAEYPKIKQIE